MGNDIMGKALLQISRSPFTERIEQAKLLRHFNQPSFTIYNGQTNPVEHEGSISSYEELSRAFRARFVTCSRVLRPLDSLLSMSMREWETLKNYSDKYWELCNEIDGDLKDVAVKTFKVGFPTHSGLWKSLTMKRPRSMCQLMDRIEKHKKVEDNQSQNKGKARIFTPDRRDNQSDQYGLSRLRKEFFSQAPHNPTGPQMVNSVFNEPIY
ncbi:uncharacterized protein LOC115966701 [Quercus lobata]|uniref:uncharacterized protein LOC115966701 n=1 Tax=Quercus lobata TaxID=97700 RepID=UPI0012464AC6|nr:uncharacterized protein LOC115966701 [Quercus lobata]